MIDYIKDFVRGWGAWFIDKIFMPILNHIFVGYYDD